MAKDIPYEDLVYVPRCRKSTIDRLADIGFKIDTTITLKDSFNEPVDMVAMKRNHL